MRRKRRRTKSKGWIALLLLILLPLIFYGCQALYLLWNADPSPIGEVPETPVATPAETPAETPVETPQEPVDTSVTFVAAGDVMVHQTQYLAQRVGDGTYDFTNNFIHVKDIVSQADFALANLETVILPGKALSAYPRFNSPAEILDGLTYAGFDILSTINNHSLDQGKNGVLSTLKELEDRKLQVLGTYKTPEEPKYVIKEVNGIRIGMTAFASGVITGTEASLNGLPSNGIGTQLNVMEMTDVSKAFAAMKVQLDALKEAGAEYLLVFLHWGNEYQFTPSTFQTKLAQLLVDEGVDLILGSHPHVVQPVEYLSSTDGTREALVVYSMGNFLSNQRREILNKTHTEDGLMVEITIDRTSGGEVKLTKATVIPTWVNLYKKDGKDTYEIVPIGQDPKASALKYQAPEGRLTESLKRTKTIITEPRLAWFSGE